MVAAASRTQSAPFRKFLLSIAALAFLAGALSDCEPAFAQSPRPSQIRVGVNLILVDATVRGPAGEPIDGLTKGNFIVRDNGVPQSIEYLGRDELPMSVVLVLDLSTSIAPFLDSLRAAATTTLALLKPDDQVALLTFSSDVDLRLQLTKDTSKLTAEFDSMQTSGGTNISDALFEAARYLLVVRPKGRRVIILISDDVATTDSAHSPHDIVDEILEADASLFNLKVPGDNRPSFKSTVDVASVVKETGGDVVEAGHPTELEPEFAALLRKIGTRYTLGYYVSGLRVDNKEHRLDVSLAPSFGVRGKDYSILSKRGYFFIPGPSAVDGHRQVGHQDTWTGSVAATDDAARTITLSYTNGETTESFTAGLPERFKVKMSDGSIQELNPSALPVGTRLTLYYIRTTEKYFGKSWTTNKIFWIDFPK